MLSLKLLLPRTLVLFCLLFLFKTTFATEPLHIGHITGLEGEVITRTAAGEKKLNLNDKVFFKQQIITKDQGKAIVTFRDGSTFEIAPNAVVILDEFIFNPTEGVSEKSVNVLKGTFRYISGLAVKNSKVEIKSPFGTAGIRGSLVVGNVVEGSLDLFVGHGQVSIKTVDGKSQVTLATGIGGIDLGNKAEIASKEKTAELAEYFRSPSLWIGLAANKSTLEERLYQANADAVANGKTLAEQIQAQMAAVAGDPPSKIETALLSPAYLCLPTDPKEIIAAYTGILNKLYEEASTKATLIIVEAAIRNNPEDAAIITQLAVAANPRIAAAIAKAAADTAPGQGAAIAEAATKGLADAKKEDDKKEGEAEKPKPTIAEQNANAAIFSAVISSQRTENVIKQDIPTTVNINQFAVSNVEAAVQQGIITPEQGVALIAQINAGTPIKDVSPSPSTP